MKKIRPVAVLAAVVAAAGVVSGTGSARQIDAESRMSVAGAPSGPASAAERRANAAERRVSASPSLVEVAVAANSTGNFDTLLALVTRYPDIVSLLGSKGQHTVFAPTDAAFANLFAAIAAPGGIEPADLTPAVVKDVLLYHVANGRRDAADVTSSTQIRMLNGDFAAVNGATIDGANIIGTDVFAANGVIHVVDAVLLPPALG